MSFLYLLLTNLLTIGIALWERWDLAVVMWIYWTQSVSIGVFNTFRILSLRKFSTENFKVNDQPVAPTVETRNSTAVFFAFHFGAFHLGYAVFLTIGQPLAAGTNLFVLTLCIAGFVANHGYSFRHNLARDRQHVRNIGALLFYPYARILPMHLTIIFGVHFATGAGGLLLFLSLKTVADLLMHCVEHKGLV